MVNKENDTNTVAINDVEQLQQMQEEAIREENNINMTDSKGVEHNHALLNTYFEDYEVIDAETGEPKWKDLTAEIRERIHAVDENGAHSDEIQEKTEETIWEIAKNRVIAARSFDFNFMAYNDNDKEVILKNDLKDYYAETTARLIGATAAIDEPQSENENLFADRAARIEASLAAIDKFLADQDAKKGVIKSTAVVAAAIEMTNKLESLVDYAKIKGYSRRVVASCEINAKKFSNKMTGLWGKLYTEGRNFIALNKEQVIAGAVATGVMGLGSVVFPELTQQFQNEILTGFAAYVGTASFAWPIFRKKNKMAQDFKKADTLKARTFNKLGFWGRVELARKSIFKNKEEKKKYWTNSILTGAASAATIGLVNSGVVSAAAHVAENTAASLAAKRAANTATLSLAGITASALHVGRAWLRKCKEDTPQNRADLKAAWYGLAASAGLGAIFTGIGFFSASNAQAASVDTNTQGIANSTVLSNDPSTAVNDSIRPQHDFADVDSIVNSQIGDANVDGADVAGAGADVQPTEIDVPQSYAESSGRLSEANWDILSSSEGFEEKYLNARNFLSGHPEAFLRKDGSQESPEEVVREIEQVLAFYSRKMENAPKFSQFFDENHVKVFPKDGQWVYEDGTPVTSTDVAVECWESKDKENFRAMYKAFICGDSIDKFDMNWFNKMYQGMDQGDRGAYMTKNICGEMIHTYIPRQAPKVVPQTPTPEPTPVDVKIEQTPTVTEVKQPDANIDLSYKQEVITGGTAPAEKGFKAPLDPLQKIDGDASKGQAFGNWVKIRGKGNGM